MKHTELLGFEIAFSLPDWFPPEAENYTQRVYYPKHHAYAGQVKEDVSKNFAMEALYELPNVHETAIMQLCGNWVTFKFEGVYHGDAPDKIADCHAALEEFLKQWIKPIRGHEYVVQGHDEGGYEVLDLTENRVVWVDVSVKACQAWIEQRPAGHLWVTAKARKSGRASRVGPFASQDVAFEWIRESRPDEEWEDVDVVSDVGEEE